MFVRVYADEVQNNDIAVQKQLLSYRYSYSNKI